jgi:hypothetical protein
MPNERLIRHLCTNVANSRYYARVTSGVMHYDMGNMKAQLDALCLGHILLTDRKLHPEIFSQGMLHASVHVISHVRL